jgi:putative flippase GtrA
MINVFREFTRYIGVGSIAFLADFAVLAILSSGFRLHYLIALVIAFLVGSIVNYQLSVNWVFTYRAIPDASMEFSLFFIVGVMTLGLSFILMTGFVEILHLHYLLAKCLTTGVTLVINFAGRKALLFTP